MASSVREATSSEEERKIFLLQQATTLLSQSQVEKFERKKKIKVLTY